MILALGALLVAALAASPGSGRAGGAAMRAWAATPNTLLVGLLLRTTGTAPDWTSSVTTAVVPLLAASGAALFVGSVLHPTQRMDPRPGLRAWALLVTPRILLFMPIAWLAPSPDIAVVALLCGLSIPAFGPAQFSTVYGYREAAVAASSRYGWLVGAAGLAACYLVIR